MAVLEIFKIIGGIFLGLWWIWLPLVFYIIFFRLWMRYIQRKYWKKINWIILEMIPPREIERSPKVMENIFAGLWQLIGTLDTVMEKYLQGMIQNYFSLEIVGISGQIHFLIRIPASFRNLVESQVYAQYPDMEINEFEDYVQNIPADLPNQDWNLWGTQLILAKPDPYPIRTYAQFMDIAGKLEEGFIDPLANLMEILSRLQPGEQVWLQILCRPVGDSWHQEGKKIIAALMGKTPEKKRGLIAQETIGWLEAGKSVVQEIITDKPAELSKKEERKDSFSLFSLSPGEQDVIKAIEQNIAKKGFESKINFLYLARREVMNKSNVGAVMGVFNQFSTLHLNGFKPDKSVTTSAYYLFAERKKAIRKRNIFEICRDRAFWKKGYVLNFEELATIFHFPSITVEAPMTPRIEAKKGAPPRGLPIK